MIFRVFLCISILLLACSQMDAQDIIHKHNGETIEAFIVDLSPGVIKYRKFDKPQGSIYSIARDQVEKIVYQNGKVVAFDEEEVKEEPLDKDPEINIEKPSPTFGWHIGLGPGSLYGDIQLSKPKLVTDIGASFTLPMGRNNTLLLGANILSLGCGIEDHDFLDQDTSRWVITNSSEDLGYLGILVTDRYFLNSKHNYYIEGGGYASLLVNASIEGEAEITDINGMVISGVIEESLVEFYKAYDFGLVVGLGGRIPLDKINKWHLTVGARFYYGLTNIVEPNIPGLEDYHESNIFGFFFVGADIPTKTKQ